jgi:hypothetical protein
MKDAEAIRALTKIFKEKEWFVKDTDDIVFNNFCDLLEVLEPSERSLLIELTGLYYWITGDEYIHLLLDVFKDIPAEFYESAKKLYLFPVIKPTDEGRPKSGTGLTYDIKAEFPRISKLRHISASTLEKFEQFKTKPGTKETELLCLVDDFIGTGDTLDQCLEAISQYMEINYDRMFIVAISCQQETHEHLIAKGVKIYSRYLIPKGISDFNEQATADKKKALMRKMEESVPGAKSFSLGFQESEAIITLKRTPDNTFPIFWKKARREGRWYDAPFYRDSSN